MSLHRLMPAKKVAIFLGLLLVVIIVSVAAFTLFPDTKNSNIVKKLTGDSPDTSKNFFVGSQTAPTRLTYAVHWFEDFQTQGIYKDGELTSKGLSQYLQEYVSLNPDIAFDVRVIEYGDYEQTLRVQHKADSVPDIYQIYSNWGVTYVNEGMLDTPPQDIIDDVKANYFSTAGVTINDQIWGVPTEINTYSLLYNKDLLREAGVTAPRTWSELLDAAKKLTKRGENGNVTQYGIAFIKGNDWQVVDPFLSLLFSNNGEFLSEDLSESLITEAAAVETLTAEAQLFRDGSTDINANFFDFKDGKVAMVISPPWTKAIFAEGFGENFESTVGVSPMPYMTKPATLQYSWFMGVMNKSKNKEAAWEFIKWFTSEIQASGTTRYGDLLANTIGAIPSRKVDLNNQRALKDFFTKVYVAQLSSSVAEPNVLRSADIKKELMSEIEAAWTEQKTPEEALQSAKEKIDKILSTN